MDIEEVIPCVDMIVDHIFTTDGNAQFLIPVKDDQCCFVSYEVIDPDQFEITVSCGDHPECNYNFEMSRNGINRDDLTEQILALMDEVYTKSCEYSIIIEEPDAPDI